MLSTQHMLSLIPLITVVLLRNFYINFVPAFAPPLAAEFGLCPRKGVLYLWRDTKGPASLPSSSPGSQSRLRANSRGRIPLLHDISNGEAPNLGNAFVCQ